MLHGAIPGFLERFVGSLIENFDGAFPAWLAPTQSVNLNITAKRDDYVLFVQDSLKNREFRVGADLRNGKISFKIARLAM